MGSMPSTAASSTSATTAAATPASGPHNEADVMFASMMIPHHNQAIEMSDMLLAKGIDVRGLHSSRSSHRTDRSTSST